MPTSASTPKITTLPTVWAAALNRAGILFLLAVGSRKYVTITYGGGVTAFTDYRIEQIEDAVVPYLSDDDWAEAASEYLSMCADTLDFYAEHGEPLDVDNDTSGWPILLLIVIGVPMIIAGIVCGVLYSQMKTARLKTEANDYIGAGLKLRVQVDNYTHTDRCAGLRPAPRGEQQLRRLLRGQRRLWRLLRRLVLSALFSSNINHRFCRWFSLVSISV